MKKSMISTVALDGLLLGVVSAVFLLVGRPSGMLAVLVWLLQTGVTVGLFWYLLKRQSLHADRFTYGSAVGYGTLTGLFSGFVCGVLFVLYITLLSPGVVDALLDQMVGLYEQLGMADTAEAVVEFRPFLPYVFFISYLFYFTFIGLLYSLVMGNFVKQTRPPFSAE
ncbi:MAG: DUF4199 domain-containing protein [Prevotellaceae bacterium]|jgi:hypothetical protein|nr:DUF4199 domain-containing protein [Prevotellaceae bacterium]